MVGVWKLLPVLARSAHSEGLVPRASRHTEETNNMDTKQMKVVYTIIDRPGDRAIWLRVGTAWVNRDGSYNIKLDALPMNGTLQVRDYAPRDDVAPRDGARPERKSEAPPSGKHDRGRDALPLPLS